MAQNFRPNQRLRMLDPDNILHEVKSCSVTLSTLIPVLVILQTCIASCSVPAAKADIAGKAKPAERNSKGMELTRKMNAAGKYQAMYGRKRTSYSLTQRRIMNFDRGGTLLTNHDRLYKDGRRMPRNINRSIGDMAH